MTPYLNLGVMPKATQPPRLDYFGNYITVIVFLIVYLQFYNLKIGVWFYFMVIILSFSPSGTQLDQGSFKTSRSCFPVLKTT